MRGTIVGLGLACGLIGCAGPESSADTAADEAAIREVISAMARANNAGDVAAWVGQFDRDAVYMPSGTRAVMDSAGLRETAESGFSRYTADIAIEPIEVVVAGEWAFVRASVSGSVTPRAGGGEPISIDNKELIVLRRQPAGRWKITRLMINSNG